MAPSYCIVGPGQIPYPPKSSGAVEIIMEEYATNLTRLGWDVSVINEPNRDDIESRVVAKSPWNVIVIHYDVFVDLVPFCLRHAGMVILVSHYGYLDNPDKWSPDFARIFSQMTAVTDDRFYLGALSIHIAQLLQSHGRKNVLFMPNGANSDKIRFASETKLFKTLCLAEISDRKRQFLLQNTPDIDFVGKIRVPHFRVAGTNSSYVGEWSKSDVYEHLTDYHTLALMSDGEGDPLVVKEALMAGLQVTVSLEACKLSPIPPWVHVVDPRLALPPCVSHNREATREHAIAHFAWPKLIETHHHLVHQHYSHLHHTPAPTRESVTVVTGWWKLTSTHKHSQAKYEEWMANFLQNVNCNLVIYTDDVRLMQSQCAERPNTKIIFKSLTDLSRVFTDDIIATQRKMDPNNRRSANAYKIWNGKVDLICETIRENPFHSKYFIWTDIGNLRDAGFAKTHLAGQWPRNPNAISRNAIDIVLLEPFQSVGQKYFFNEVHFSASMMGGPGYAWTRLHDVYYLTLADYIEHQQFAGCDQQVLSSCYQKDPTLFHLVKPVGKIIDPWFYLWLHYGLPA